MDSAAGCPAQNFLTGKGGKRVHFGGKLLSDKELFIKRIFGALFSVARGAIKKPKLQKYIESRQNAGKKAEWKRCLWLALLVLTVLRFILLSNKSGVIILF